MGMVEWVKHGWWLTVDFWLAVQEVNHRWPKNLTGTRAILKGVLCVIVAMELTVAAAVGHLPLGERLTFWVATGCAFLAPVFVSRATRYRYRYLALSGKAIPYYGLLGQLVVVDVCSWLFVVMWFGGLWLEHPRYSWLSGAVIAVFAVLVALDARAVFRLARDLKQRSAAGEDLAGYLRNQIKTEEAEYVQRVEDSILWEPRKGRYLASVKRRYAARLADLERRLAVIAEWKREDERAAGEG